MDFFKLGSRKRKKMHGQIFIWSGSFWKYFCGIFISSLIPFQWKDIERNWKSLLNKILNSDNLLLEDLEEIQVRLRWLNLFEPKIIKAIVWTLKIFFCCKIHLSEFEKIIHKIYQFQILVQIISSHFQFKLKPKAKINQKKTNFIFH